MREYPLQYATTDKNKKSHYNSISEYNRVSCYGNAPYLLGGGGQHFVCIVCVYGLPLYTHLTALICNSSTPVELQWIHGNWSVFNFMDELYTEITMIGFKLVGPTP